MSNGGSHRINVSEDTLRALFAEFKLEIVEELKAFATTAAVEMIDARVKILELWQANIIGQGQKGNRISDRALAWAALIAGLVGSISVIAWIIHG